MIGDSYKHILYLDTSVEITHYILDEYEEEVDNPNKTYSMYKKEIIESYNLASNLGYCKIIEITEEFIIISMDKYFILSDNIKNFIGSKPFIKKFFQLIESMWISSIIHLDFAPRNIGIDSNGNFKLIDLNELYKFTDKNEFISWLNLNEFEFVHAGLGKKYSKVKNIIIDKINKQEI